MPETCSSLRFAARSPGADGRCSRSVGAQVKASVKRLCEACRLVRRRGVLFNLCKKNPRHKQRQGLHAAAAAAADFAAADCTCGAGPAAAAAPRALRAWDAFREQAAGSMGVRALLLAHRR